MTNRDELVTGQEAHKRHDEGIREGRSIFYTTVDQLSKSAEPLEPYKRVDVPPTLRQVDLAEKLNSLEYSRASVTSTDVAQMITSASAQDLEWLQLRQPVDEQSSYSPVETGQIKVLVVGDRFTGKSSLIQQTTAADFSCQYQATQFLNCSSKTVRHKDNLYSVIFWDLTENILHEENHFKEVCKGAMAAFVVYDLSRVTTLSSIADCKKKIHNTVCKKNGNPIPVYLLGNKCDMEECQKDGASFAKLHKFTGHFRTSAKTGKGIEEAVKAAVNEILSETYPHPPEICETPIHHKIQ